MIFRVQSFLIFSVVQGCQGFATGTPFLLSSTSKAMNLALKQRQLSSTSTSTGDIAECVDEEGAANLINEDAECLEEGCASVEDCNVDFMDCPPVPIDGIPGEDLIEDQPVRNPIDATSHVIVVGGSRGIGLEFVKQCLQKWADVVATHREDLPPQNLQTLLEEYPDNLSFLQMDVGDSKSVASAAAELRSRRKPGEEFIPLTHIIHSAGAYFPGMSFDGSARGGRKPQPVVTEHDMIESFRINAVGPLLMAQSFVPLLGKASSRPAKDLPVLSILTSKVGSVYDNSSGGTYAYRSSKSALNQIAKSISVDFAGEVSVVLLHPGYVRTDMTSGNGLIDTDQSVEGMLRAVESTDASVGFRFVDYKACIIPW